MDMGAILFNGAEPFEQTDRWPHVKSGENWSSNFREDVLRLHDFIYVYSLAIRADNSRGIKF